MPRPLLMIPGPIEISPSVLAASSTAPPSHVSPGCIEAFGASLEMMRKVWRASKESQPFVLAGSGTLAMDVAISNTVDAIDRVVVVNSGYFSDRIAEMATRRGAEVVHVRAAIGKVPELEAIEAAIKAHVATVVIATHVDTSTGARVDAEAIARLARSAGALSIFDGVCATAAEVFEMQAWDADIYLTASQKAIGLPPGLAMLVASPRALARRASLASLPPMYMDFEQWVPIMRAYEERRGSYFATPATPLIMALQAGLTELVEEGVDEVAARHAKTASAMRAAWRALGLELLGPETCAANALSAIRYPAGVGSTLPSLIGTHGVVVAGGLHPDCKSEYFRVGHMGFATTQPEWLERTVQAIEDALNEAGYVCCGGVAALSDAL
jgi:alanine-glyoxylate transaminase/serine-glyoxylate transaminase/serine-pyruvate transaminase